MRVREIAIVGGKVEFVRWERRRRASVVFFRFHFFFFSFLFLI